jgi:hypothetical protein
MSHLTDLARAAARAQDDSTAVDAAPGQRFDELLNDARVPRRALLRGGVAGSIAAMLAACGGGGDDGLESAQARLGNKFKVGFKPVAESSGDTVVVPEGYRAQVLFSAGDAVAPGAIAYSGSYLASSDAEKVAGGNHDGMHFYELPGVEPNKGGLLAINHEFPDFAILMSGGYNASDTSAAGLERKRLALSAVGVSVIEVERVGNGFQERWQVVADSKYNRRYSGNTLYAVSGPAAPAVGASVVGTLNNCASGMTPWGTYLTCEETTDNYLDPTQNSLGYGWVVEIDPYGELANMPVKRTALGRFDHENTAYLMAADGTLAIYMGDDSTPGCIYKFVSDRKVDRANRAANANLLDDGILYVAQFHDDGTVKWLPMIFGEGPLAAANGFSSQADILIDTRRAADLLQATPMDRPEDVEPNPVSGRVYLVLTNNNRRTAQSVNKANPRPNNEHGHIIEIIPPGGAGPQADHAATEAKWTIFLLAGKPGIDPGVMYHRAVTDAGWLSCPDMAMVDNRGRLWIGTDGAPTAAGIADGLYAMDTVGPGRALPKLFYTCPTGAELCGPCLTPDNQTLFVAVQHPGEDRGSTFEKPSTRWPDFQSGMPPRPSVVAITKRGGGVIGS